ncbi:VENN motif pre-toxin domain-containing protein [Pandoraea sp. PE-S2R-1]|uniref:VENN motif pre-toxin domain-containing protein n=1 Tax=Pandoraea sp. PE-S2R-1 TaxID=1986994 RepID=UPI001BAE60F4|nr:VENN motif pre-toxin domain-containing protein [Pandoraea sp. PE-S2R-1]
MTRTDDLRPTGVLSRAAFFEPITYLQGLAAKEIKTLGENLDPASKAALHAIAGCAGGAASGGGCDAGAMGSAAGSLLGSLLASTDKPGQPLTQSEREARVNLITSIVAGVAAGTGGDVVTASTGAKTEAENNTLGIISPMPPPIPPTGSSVSTGGSRGANTVDALDPNGNGRNDTESAVGKLAEALREALMDAACKVSALACASHHSVEQAIGRVGSDASDNPTITSTPNNGPSGATITTTPDSGEKGPTLTGTPDQGERGATITTTPDQGPKGPTITATPNDGPVVFDPMLSADGTPRPTHRQSEIDVGDQLTAKAREQVSFKDGKEVPHGTAGSVRPDWCIGTICSIEVKNYNIEKNRWGLISNVSKQAAQRQEHLPPGMEQHIVIDVRGQSITSSQEDSIIRAIVEKSNWVIGPTAIEFKK